MLTWYSIQCRWECHILSEISDRWKRRDFDCWLCGQEPVPWCCLPCWALAEESVAYTMSTHHLRQFSASIVGSKLTGTATVRAYSPCHSSIADPRTPVYTPTPLSTTIHPYPLSPTTPWLTTHTSTIGPEWQKKRNSGRGLMRSLDGKTPW